MIIFFYYYVILDDDECASSDTNDCHANAACTNTEGSFTCACNAGYTGNGKTTCAGKRKITI